jgi:hypothetical protein
MLVSKSPHPPLSKRGTLWNHVKISPFRKGGQGGILCLGYQFIKPNQTLFMSVHPETAQCHSKRSEESQRTQQQRDSSSLSSSE